MLLKNNKLKDLINTEIKQWKFGLYGTKVKIVINLLV